MHRPSSLSTAVVCLAAGFAWVCAPRSAAAQAVELVGLRAQGMGGAFTAVADDATATWWNPAGLAGGPFFNGLFEYGRADRPSETRATGLAFAVPSLGFSYYRIPVSQIRPISPTGQPSENRQDQGVFSQFGATIGQSLGAHLVVASTLKLTRALDDTSGGLDIGAMGRYKAFRAGISVKNVTEPAFGSGASRLELARAVRVGAALVEQPRQGRVNQVTVAFDADLTVVPSIVGDERHISGGGEVWMLQRRLGLRGGVAANTIGAARGSASAGVSVGVFSRTYVDAVVTGGSDPVRKGWGAGFRMTF